MLMSGDIDGLVSAGMLARAAPGWYVGALIVKSGRVLIHPELVDALSVTDLFGVDVFSTYMDNVSNHVALWGTKRPGGNTEAFAAARAYDLEVQRRASNYLLATPSLWAGMEGSHHEAGKRPTGAGYRYPLGTAHILLALLESSDASPRIFDREYLPWLIANCDGGLKTIRDYAYNVPMWWGCLGAVVGPASLTESLYQLAANQRPTEFGDVVNRLRAEGGTAAAHLDDNWNLRGQSAGDFAAVIAWITSISGWPDPILGGADQLHAWPIVDLVDHGHLLTSGLPSGDDNEERIEGFKYGLRRSLGAIHTNFNFFDQSQRLNWVAPWQGLDVVAPPTPAELEPVIAAPPAVAQQDRGDFSV
jgi:hypothetical protein